MSDKTHEKHIIHCFNNSASLDISAEKAEPWEAQTLWPKFQNVPNITLVERVVNCNGNVEREEIIKVKKQGQKYTILSDFYSRHLAQVSK